MKYIINRSKTSDDRLIATVRSVVDTMYYDTEQDTTATMSILLSTLKANKCNEVALQIDEKPIIRQHMNI